MEKSKTNIEEFLSFPNYLEITDDENEFKNLKNEKLIGKAKSEKSSRSRDKSLDKLKTYRKNKDDRHQPSKNDKYKRYDISHSSSSSRDDSSLYKRHKHLKSKNKVSRFKKDAHHKHKRPKFYSSSSKSSSESESESDSISSSQNSSYKNINSRSYIKTEDPINSLPNFFEEKKSKWSTVKEDELKQKEKSHIIQVNPLLNKIDFEPKIENSHKTKIDTKSDHKEKVTIQQYKPPANSNIPNQNWRLISFKDKEKKDIYKIDTKAFYLIGKEEKANDIVINHPSCSRQHSAIQFLKSEKDHGIKINIIDLKSTNGTFVNKMKIEPERYYELKEYDLINFGNSTRDYVIMLEK